MKVVILAGGKGSRFWPRSVETKPKQFLAITSQETMVQQTYRRFRQWLSKENVYVATTRRYLPLLLEQIPELDAEQMIVEPEQRDTGPCIALTALHFLQKGEDEVLVTAPSDQYIPDGEALRDALIEAAEAAEVTQAIATLGIVPTRPETGYGYIETLENPSWGRVYPVKRFIEKPANEIAQKLILQKNIYWNSGIFIWKPSTIAYYMEKYQQQMWEILRENIDDVEKVYSQIPKISVDYAILMKAEQIYTVPVHFVWDDMGSWTSMGRVHSADQDGNIVEGSVYPAESFNNIIFSEQKPAVIIGVKDLIIVSTNKGLLVCHQSEEHKIKNVLQSFFIDEGGNE